MNVHPSEVPNYGSLQPKLPGSLQAATIVMFVGSGFGAVAGFFFLAAVPEAAVFGVIFLAAAAVTVWLSIMIRRGRNWARITATVLLAIDMVAYLTALDAAAAVGLAVHGLLLGLLWSTSAREYFQQVGSGGQPAPNINNG